MTRLYIQPSFLNSCEDHGEWSGGNDQYRGDKSVDLSTFDKNGRARMEAFSDEAVEALKQKNKPKLSIADKILPQQRRVLTLTNQMRELVADYKANLYTIEEYSLLMDVLVAKKERAEELLQKARNMKPKSATQSDEALSHRFNRNAANQPKNLQQKRKFACNSAKADLVYYISAVTGLFTAFMIFMHW